VQVDAAKRLDVAIALTQSGGLDGGGAVHAVYASGQCAVG